MLTAAVGIAHAVLFIAAFGLMISVPGARAADSEIVEFYNNYASRRLTLVGLYVMPFAGIAFMWFSVSLRVWISHSQRREDQLLSGIQLASGLLYVAMFFASGATSAASAASIEFSGAEIDTTVARQLPLYGQTLLLVFAVRMAAMFVFSTSSIARAAGVLPRWFTWAGYAVGLFMLLSATFTVFLVLVFPLWLLCLCVLMLLRARRLE